MPGFIKPQLATLKPKAPKGDHAFDLLWRDGDLRKLPEIECKHMLSDLLGENDIHLPIIYSEHLIGDGQEMFELAAKLNFEGIVSKNAQALIDRSAPKPGSRSNRAEREIPGHWFVKIRYWRGCALSREAKCKDLVYMGKAGTGWSRTVSSQIRKLLS